MLVFNKNGVKFYITVGKWTPYVQYLLKCKIHCQKFTSFTLLKISTIADEKLTKSHSNFENKQPNCTILFIFVLQLPFIDCILSKIVGFDQLWTAVQQKLVTTNRKLVFFKMPNTFCWFTVQNWCYFLSWLRSSSRDFEKFYWKWKMGLYITN